MGGDGAAEDVRPVSVALPELRDSQYAVCGDHPERGPGAAVGQPDAEQRLFPDQRSHVLHDGPIPVLPHLGACVRQGLPAPGPAVGERIDADRFGGGAVEPGQRGHVLLRCDGELPERSSQPAGLRHHGRRTGAAAAVLFQKPALCQPGHGAGHADPAPGGTAADALSAPLSRAAAQRHHHCHGRSHPVSRLPVQQRGAGRPDGNRQSKQLLSGDFSASSGAAAVSGDPALPAPLCQCQPALRPRRGRRLPL